MLASSSHSSPTFTGASPTYKARAGFCSPRAFASPSRPSQSRSASRPTNTVTSTTLPKATTAVQSPPLATADAGTQYSPPDWPPTYPRSSRYKPPLPSSSQPSSDTADHKHVVRPLADGPKGVQEPPPPSHTGDKNGVPTPPTTLAPPPEPQLRITPQQSIQANATRRRSSEDLTTAKRPRQEQATDRKVLPSDYTQCEAKVLASLIATMLMRLIQHNDQIPLRDGQLTRFHSRAPPTISVADYMQRLTFHATLSPPILLAMVFFIDRLSSNFNEFTINSLTVHRFLITAATVASKGLSDSFWTNQTYAKVGGVSIKELALLELELLQKCGWKIVPQPERLVEYYKGLVEGSEDFVLEGEDAEPEQRKDSDDSMDTSGSNV